MWKILAFCFIFAGCALAKSVFSNKASWKYVGCYNDKRPRDLSSYHKDESTKTPMTLERCYKFCSGYKNMYMALQEGEECRCDNNYGRYGVTDDANCDEKCTGDSSQACGGEWANSIYQIRDEAATKITADMMTLKADQKLVFTILGDWGKAGSPQVDVAKQLGIWAENHNSAFTMAIGDNFYERGVTSVKDPKFKTVWKDVYTHRSLQHPWLVIEGNHDYYDGNAPYQVMYGDIDKRWIMPSLYYSTHYTVGVQDVHLIFLDTDPIKNEYEFHQLNWFRDEIENSKADWVIVIGHHPVFSSGPSGSESSTAPMYDDIRSEMVKHKAALYICGHDHFMEHIVDSTGIVDFVMSGSAAKLETSNSSSAERNISKKNALVKYWNPDYGFAAVEIDGDMAKVFFVDRNGKEVYSFSKQNPRASSKDTVVG